MNSSSFVHMQKVLPDLYVQQAIQAISARESKIRILYEQKKCPEDGWDEKTIELLLHQLSLMDSNNFPGNCGIGEREARFASQIVARRHYWMGHGIGRSGDIVEIQPKAAGSSLMNRLTNSCVLDALKFSGVSSAASCFIAPMATGMSLALCLLAFHQKRPNARYVIWPRIDQKSCFKCMVTAGFLPVIIENQLEGDALCTNVDEIKKQIGNLGCDNILCIFTTTSCFAPRTPDKLEEIAVICKEFGIPHLINNAYGVQSSKCMHLIQQASQVGRVDVFVQSTDKNFMVPVGGSIIAGFDKSLIDSIGKTYPGRASGTASLDMFITLLNLGHRGYKKLLSERKEMYVYLKKELHKIGEKHGEKVLDIKHNPISLAFSLNNFNNKSPKELTLIGSMLFTRWVSGARVVAPGENKEICGYTFKNWGSHSNVYPHAYVTAAAAIGITKEDIDTFIRRLDKVLTKTKSEDARKSNTVPLDKCDPDSSSK